MLTFFRIVFYSFVFVMIWKIMVNRRAQREQQMDEYMLMQRDMEIMNRMQKNPELLRAMERELLLNPHVTQPYAMPGSYPPPPGYPPNGSYR